MQRAASFRLDQLTAESAAFVQHSADFISYLERSLQPELLNLLALPEVEGNYCSFYTFLEGEVHSADGMAADAFFQGKSAQLAAAVSGMQQGPYAAAASFVLDCINNPRHLIAVAGNKVILPVILKNDPPPAAAAPAEPAAAEAAKSPRSKLPWLLLLLLLLLAAALAAWLLQDDDEAKPEPDVPSAPAAKSADSSGLNLPDVNIPEINLPDANLPDVTMPEMNLPDVNLPEANLPEMNLPEVNVNMPDANLPAVNLSGEKQPGVNEVKQQEADPAPSPAMIAPLPEGRTSFIAPFPETEEKSRMIGPLPENRPQPAAASDPTPAPVREQAFSPAKTAAPAPKPKCTTLRQENKLPSLILAVDGSASMFERLGSSQSTRMEAAKQAATGMIDNISTAVRVNLIDINSCPAARNYGWFGGSRQSRFSLRGMINDLKPLGNGTALMSGLNQVAESAQNTAGRVEAVMISDGLDACGHELSDICRRAQTIHRYQPDLKIHVVILDNSISGLKCVASATGGRVFQPQNAAEFARQLQQVGSDLNEVCEE